METFLFVVTGLPGEVFRGTEAHFAGIARAGREPRRLEEGEWPQWPRMMHFAGVIDEDEVGPWPEVDAPDAWLAEPERPDATAHELG